MRKRWRSAIAIGIAVVLAGLAAGLVLGLRASSVEQAKATILINPLDGNPFSTTGNGDDLVNMYTESELLKSDAVSELVADDLGLDETPASLRKGLSVAVPPNSQIIEIEYESSSEADSVARAQSFAEQYLLFRQSRAEERTADQTAQVQKQVRERTREQDQLAEQLADAAPDSTSASVLQARLDAVSAQINQLRARVAEINSAPISPGQVVTPAASIDRGLLAHWFIYVIAGGLAGLAAAVALAIVRARLDNRIREAEDITALGHTVLGELSPGDILRIADAPAGKSLQSAISEGLRRLRVSILTADRRRPLTILLATASQAQSRPLTAESLALTLAASRLPTILVDTVPDEKARALPGTSRRATMEDVISGNGSPQQALTSVRPFIKVMQSTDPAALDDSVQAPQMATLLESLRELGDITVVTSGSIYEARSQALSASCDVVLIEAVSGESTYPDLMRVKDLTGPVPDKLLGVVLVTGRPMDPTPATPTPEAQPEPEPSEPAKSQDRGKPKAPAQGTTPAGKKPPVSLAGKARFKTSKND